MKMLCDCKRANRLIAALVILVSLSHRTTGGSWRNLEKLFIEEKPANRHWNDNRIIFPDMVEELPVFSSPSTPTRGDNTRPCQSDCPVSREYSPVCGTNGVTYQNMGQLQCDIRCGVAVDLHRPVACSETIPPHTTRRYPPSATTTTTNSPTYATVSDKEVDRCIRSCPSTPEYNPVCGTNHVTYNNPGKLECAKNCGVDVQFWRYARCPTLRTTTSSTVAPATNSELDVEIENCINDCPSTSEYDPICGSNNVTYTNIGRLECAKWCGVDVRVHKRERCEFLSYALTPDSDRSVSPPDVDYGEDKIDTRFRPRDQ